MFKNDSVKLSVDNSENYSYPKNINYTYRTIEDDTPNNFSGNTKKIDRLGGYQFGIIVGDKKPKFNNTVYTAKDAKDYYSEYSFLIFIFVFLYIVIYLKLLDKFVQNNVKCILLCLVFFCVLTLIILVIYPIIDFDLPYIDSPYIHPDIFYKDALFIEIMVFTFAFLVFFSRAKSFKKQKEIFNLKYAAFIALFSGMDHYLIPIVIEDTIYHYIFYIPITLLALLFGYIIIHEYKKPHDCIEVLFIIAFLLSIYSSTINIKLIDS